MKKIKKYAALLIALMLCLNISTLKPKAADVSVTIALSASSINVGDSLSVTVNVNGSSLSAYTLYVSYNADVLKFNSGSGSAAVNSYGAGTVIMSGASAGSVSLSFTAVAAGTASITTSGSEVYDINLETLSISHAGVTVTVADPNSKPETPTTEEPDTPQTTEAPTTEEDTRSDNCRLSSLQITPGKLEPDFSPDVTNYFVQVDADVTSMIVSAVTEDSKATTKVWGAGLIEPGENTVKITVTAENGATRVYYLRVVAGSEKGDANVVIDDEFYKFANNENVEGIPEGFDPITIEYKEWNVLAFEAPSKEFVIVCLINVEGDFCWFIYDEAADTFSPYREYSSRFNRYIIIPIPEGTVIPEGFEEVDLTINDNPVKAYKSKELNDNALYLVYAVNIEGGEGFYVYDTVEQNFLRYVPQLKPEPEVVVETITATVTDVIHDNTPNKDDGLLKKLLIAIGALSGLLILLVIILFVRNRIMKNEVREAEDMVATAFTDRDKLSDEVLGDTESGKLSQTDGRAAANDTVDEAKNESDDEDTPSAVETAVEAEEVTVKERHIDNKNISFVESMNNIETISFGPETEDKKESADTIEAGYKPDDKEINYEEYAMNSEKINNIIKEDYDVSKDSAFAESERTKDASNPSGEE